MSTIIGFVAYNFGKQKSAWITFQLQKGDFVATLNASQKLRDGNTQEALRVIEDHCYAEANMLLEEKQKTQEDSTIKKLMPELVQYREKYAGSTNTWTYMEQHLEKNLKDTGFK